MHIGAVAIFAPAGSVQTGRLRELVADRAARVPRLGRRISTRWWPPGAASWVDDPEFVADDHVHAHELQHETRVTTVGHAANVDDRFARRVAAIMAEPLDLRRPPWEIHVISGLRDGKFAVAVKLHHALVDGLGAVRIGMELFDGTPPPAPQRPCQPAPGLPRLDPIALTGQAVAAAPRLLRQAGQVLGIASSAVGNALRSLPPSPLATPSSADRDVAMVKLDLREVKRIRRHHGGTVNDLLLAVVSGALRDWLTARGDMVGDLPVRALIPVSQRHRATGGAGNQLSGYLCDLPVNEPDPHRRLRAIRATMDRNKAAGPDRGPGAIAVLAEQLPPAVHRVATPIFGQGATLLFDTVITNVPLPGLPLSLDGSELSEIYPLVPLAPNHALGVALSTYRDAVHIGLQADRLAIPDLHSLGEAIPRALRALEPDVSWPVASSAAR